MVYVSFVAVAIIGRLSEADATLHRYEAEIEKVARYFRSQKPPGYRKLYRGMLLEDRYVEGAATPEARAKKIVRSYDSPGKFLSFSTDKDVACFFGDPSTQMSMVISAHRPDAHGYLLTWKEPDAARVLWTYEWSKMPVGDQKVDFVSIILRSNLASRAAVIHRNLGEQCEVITKLLRPSDKMRLDPLHDVNCPPTRELDRRFGD